jgi:hypothetical protein
MITSKTSEQLAHIARNGGSLVVDGALYSDEQLAHVARNLSQGSFLQICNADRFTDQQLAHIARNGKVVFS